VSAAVNSTLATPPRYPRVDLVEFTALPPSAVAGSGDVDDGSPVPNGFGSTKDFPDNRGDFTDAEEQVLRQVEGGVTLTPVEIDARRNSGAIPDAQQSSNRVGDRRAGRAENAVVATIDTRNVQLSSELGWIGDGDPA